MKVVERVMRTDVFVGSMLVVLGVLVGLAGGYFAERANANDFVSSVRKSLVPVEQKGTSYAFTHPLLAYRTPEASVLGEYSSLQSSVQSIINAATKSGDASRVSFYFRDLSGSEWVGINETQTYYPASLLKVPVLIAYYKQAEEDPLILDQTVTYNPSVIPNEPFDATSTLVAGRTYSVSELINYMIVDSDNGATFTLLDRINPDFLNAVYIALGVPNPGDDSANYQISTRTYAFFFRVLYNATYLSPEYSEKALKLLSEATFTDGLVAGTSQGTVVAHKYGEHVLSQGNTVAGVELSDCGVVYYPAHPYLLCVMTSASGLDTAENIISKISETTYAAVGKEYATTTPAS